MLKFSNLIINNSRQRKIYEKGAKANTVGMTEDDALAKFTARNNHSESYTLDDDESFYAGYEFAAATQWEAGL